jgi:cell division protein FtsL
MSESFEYAVRKDVRNNPIIREVDSERHAEMWKWAGLGGLVALTVMFWTWQHFDILRHGYRLEEQQKERAQLESEGWRLQVEIGKLKSLQRIDDLARTRLKLVAPGREDAIVIERVVPSEAPAKSVVAQR